MKCLCFALIALTAQILQSHDANACTAFLMRSERDTVVGFNEDWCFDIPGMVVLNKRGITKHGMSFGALTTDTMTSAPVAHWVSRYGSITFNPMGREFPLYGLNERGLFVVELFLGSTKPPVIPDRPRLFFPQWIQYQLDHFSTAIEVAEHAASGPMPDFWLDFPGSHFFVADATGNTAAIEFIDGKPVISCGAAMPAQILCNEPYAAELSELKGYQGFGGTAVLSEGSQQQKVNRFIRAAFALRNHALQPTSDAINEAFALLEQVRLDPRWQLVADLRNNRVYFRTSLARQIRWFDMAAFDFSTQSPVLVLDINKQCEGDVQSHFVAWSPELNETFVRQGTPPCASSPNGEVFLPPAMLKTILRRLSDYPLTTGAHHDCEKR